MTNIFHKARTQNQNRKCGVSKYSSVNKVSYR